MGSDGETSKDSFQVLFKVMEKQGHQEEVILFKETLHPHLHRFNSVPFQNVEFLSPSFHMVSLHSFSNSGLTVAFSVKVSLKPAVESTVFSDVGLSSMIYYGTLLSVITQCPDLQWDVDSPSLSNMVNISRPGQALFVSQAEFTAYCTAQKQKQKNKYVERINVRQISQVEVRVKQYPSWS